MTTSAQGHDQPVGLSLLTRGHSPESAQRIYTEKVKRRPLYLKASSPPPSDARDARRRAREQVKQKQKLRPKPISARQRRKLGIYDVPRQDQKYSIYAPLSQLWCGYMREILGNEVYTGGQGAAAKLSSAEFHGAEVEVSRSGCVSRVGIKGIIIKDAKFAFEILTKKNKIKLVPKEGTVFRFEVPLENTAEEGTSSASNANLVFEVYGDQLLLRSADRANKKFKQHFFKNI
jgi:ribonuclease P protein subunit POP4